MKKYRYYVTSQLRCIWEATETQAILRARELRGRVWDQQERKYIK